MTEKELHKTRLKLTLVYFLIIFVILNIYALVSSSVNLGSLDRVIENGSQNRVFVRAGSPFNLSDEDQQEIQARINEARNRLILINILLQVALLTSAATASYVLSGMTLEPIILAYKQQKEFIIRASHELKTPLTIMKLHSESDAESKKAAELKEFRDSTQEELERMQVLVNRLLKSVKKNDWNKQYNEGVELEPIMNTVVNRYQKLAAAKQLNFQFIYKPKTKVSVAFGKAELEEVLSVLLDNAIKYNRPEGKVEVLVTATNSQAVVEVSDSGNGIAEADLTKIFNRFYRGENPGVDGFGLGLSIARELVESYGAELQISSELGKGTEATLTLQR